VSMELWDADAIDLVEPGFIECARGGSGRLAFIAVWEGSDEGDPVSGRGWAVLTGEDPLEGRIVFHLGDDSGLLPSRE